MKSIPMLLIRIWGRSNLSRGGRKGVTQFPGGIQKVLSVEIKISLDFYLPFQSSPILFPSRFKAKKESPISQRSVFRVGKFAS